MCRIITAIPGDPISSEKACLKILVILYIAFTMSLQGKINRYVKVVGGNKHNKRILL
jgi:hypothetical protein